jgi:hypothetical protein
MRPSPIGTSVRTWTRLLGAAVLTGALAACGGDPGPGAGGAGNAPGTGGSGAAGGNGATGGAGGTGAGGAGGAGGTGAGGAIGQGPLIERGLLTRYFIDEADAGQTVLELQDAAPDPLPLAITYGPELTFATDGENRGLEWTAPELDGRASVAVDGSKLVALHGSKTGTIEVVIDVDEVTSSNSRISHIGFDFEGGRFSLTSPTTSRLRLFWQDSELAGDWPVPLAMLGRVVVHAVLDTSLPDPADRARLFVNASPVARIGGTPPALDQVIDLSTGTHYVLGNREIGLRSFRGRLYYAAMYTSALTTDEVLHNAAILSTDDDAPPAPSP